MGKVYKLEMEMRQANRNQAYTVINLQIKNFVAQFNLSQLGQTGDCQCVYRHSLVGLQP